MRIRSCRDVWVAAIGIDKVIHVNGARRFNLILRAAADENGLAEEQNGQLRSFLHTRDINAHRGCGLNVCRRVHLIDQRPDGGAGYNSTYTACRIVQKVAACAGLVFCV
jgi:hypothetical protein